MTNIVNFFMDFLGRDLWAFIFSLGVISAIFKPFFKRFSNDLWT